MAPWDSGRAFRNFSERRGRFHNGHAAHRLRALKALVDGDDLFVAEGRIRGQTLQVRWDTSTRLGAPRGGRNLPARARADRRRRPRTASARTRPYRRLRSGRRRRSRPAPRGSDRPRPSRRPPRRSPTPPGRRVRGPVRVSSGAIGARSRGARTTRPSTYAARTALRAAPGHDPAAGARVRGLDHAAARDDRIGEELERLRRQEEAAAAAARRRHHARVRAAAVLAHRLVDPRDSRAPVGPERDGQVHRGPGLAELLDGGQTLGARDPQA